MAILSIGDAFAAAPFGPGHGDTPYQASNAFSAFATVSRAAPVVSSGRKVGPAAASFVAAKPAAAAATPAKSSSSPAAAVFSNGGCGPEPARTGSGIVKPYADPAAGKAWLDCVDRASGHATAQPSASPQSAPYQPDLSTQAPAPASSSGGGPSAASSSPQAAPPTPDPSSAQAPAAVKAPNPGALPAGSSSSLGTVAAVGGVVLVLGLGAWLALR